MSNNKTIIIPQSVLDKFRGHVLSHKELDLLCHDNRIDFAIEHLYNKISIEQIANKYKMDIDYVNFIIKSFYEIVNKYILSIRKLINIQSIDVRFPMEIKLKMIIECTDNLVPIPKLAEKYNVPITNIYKWISIFKNSNNDKKNIIVNHVKSSFIKSLPHNLGVDVELKPIKNDNKIELNKRVSSDIKTNLHRHKLFRKRLSRKEKIIILDNYFNSELNIEDLSKKYNTTISNIIRWRDDYLKGKNNNIFAEKIKSIAQDYLDGKLSKEFLKNKYAITGEKIFMWAKKYKLLINKNDQIHTKIPYDNIELRNQIVDEYENGNLSIKEIAVKYKINTWDIYNWKKSQNYLKHNSKNRLLQNDKNNHLIQNNLDKIEIKSLKMPDPTEDSKSKNHDLDTFKELEKQKMKNELLMEIIKEISGGNFKKTS